MDVVEAQGSVSFSVRVQPRASRSEVVGEQNGALRLRLNSPPVDGAANDECVRVLAKALGVARSAVSILAGERSRNKRVRVDGLTVAELLEKLDLH
jgi:hypothetical protein